MKLVVGLGNPGKKYKKTRHNVGFMVLDSLAQKITGRSWSHVKKFNTDAIYLPALGEDRHAALCIAKPQTMMNLSGEPVSKLVNYFEIEKDDLWVVHDDLDIKIGEHKIQKGKGPKDHNGLNSIYEKLGFRDFWHVRTGVENRHSEVAQSTSRGPVRGAKHSLTGKDYILQNFSDDEVGVINKVISIISNELKEKLYSEK